MHIWINDLSLVYSIFVSIFVILKRESVYIYISFFDLIIVIDLELTYCLFDQLNICILTPQISIRAFCVVIAC